MKNLRHIFYLLFLLIIYSISFNLAAETLVWTNTAGGNWSQASNWSPNVVPSIADTAEITTEGVLYFIGILCFAIVVGFVGLPMILARNYGNLFDCGHFMKFTSLI